MRGMRLVVAIVLGLGVISTGIALAADSSSSNGFQAERELVSERTATSQTFQLPNGALQTNLFQVPIFYRDSGGSWKPIDESLEEQPDGSGLTNGANSFELSLPERVGDAPLRLSVGDRWVSAGLVGPSSDLVQSEDTTATYEAAGSGTSFNFTSLPNGVKEDIELAGPSSPHTYSFELDASEGLTPVLTDGGSIEFRAGKDGGAFATIPAPVMFDSSPVQPLVSRSIHYELESKGEESWILSVIADEEWLHREDLTWPVHLDPTFELNSPSLDCTIGGTAGAEGWGLCGSAGQKQLYARYRQVEGKDEWSRSLLKFDLGLFSPSYIENATLSVHAPSAALNTSGVEARRVTKSWTSSANWLRYNPPIFKWTSEGGDYTAEGAEVLTEDRGGEAGWWDFDLTSLVDDWIDGFPTPNQGVIIKLLDEKSGCCSERSVVFDSSAATDSSKRPKLSITYFSPAPFGNKVVSPTQGTKTARRLKLKSKWDGTGITGVTYQFKEGSLDPFKTIPTSLVRNAAGEEVKWPVATEGNESPPLFFDAAHATATLRKKGGTVHVRALFEGTTGAGYSLPVKATVDRFIGGSSDATTSVGPGSVNLLTGNLTVQRQDVSIPGVVSGLEFSRTHNSRAAGSEPTGVLGPGWKPGVSVESAGGAEWKSIWDANGAGEGAYVLLTDLEGYEYAFEQTGEKTYASPPEFTGWVLSRENSTELALSDPGGNRTVFKKNEGDFTYAPVAVSQAGGGSTQMVYQVASGKLRLEKIIAASPGLTCTPSNATTTVGCRSLTFTYMTPAEWGGTSGQGDRLGKVRYYGPTSGTTMSNWIVAQYTYNSEGRLVQAWDPRSSPDLIEKYAYAAGGQLQTITPPGEEPWTLEYGSYDEEEANGRLVVVKRPSLVEGTPVAQTTIAYGVPITGSGAPYDLGGEAVAKWGQEDIPVDATAIFPPDQVPAEPPSSYSRATVYYMDAEGMAVNTATPSGAGTSAPSITTTETDEFGNVVRELSAQNRLRALGAGSESVTRSKELDTHRTYVANGTEMTEELGPLHDVRLESGVTVQARMRTLVQYDEGWVLGIGGPAKPHQPTRETTGAFVPAEGAFLDQRVTETKYDWGFRRPIETIIDPTGLNIRTKTVYGAFGLGQPTEIRQPAGPEGGDAHTTKIAYYGGFGGGGPHCLTSGAGYTGLPCEVKPAAQPGTEGQPEILVKKITGYASMGQPTEVIESPGGKEEATRKTIATYDTLGREKTVKIEGGGAAIPKRETLYWSTTGRLKTTRFICEVECTGFDNQAITTTYDTLGRITAYTDADVKKSTVSYDLLGRPVSTFDAKGTQTMSYDPTSGLLVSLSDSGAGTFTASYDADGNMVQRSLPNGLVATTTYDEAGAPVGLSYDKVAGCSSECNWLSFSAERSIHGQVLSQTSTLSTQDYAYDKAGRLGQVKDTPQGGECTTRTYNYDADSNRTALITRAPKAGGACDTSSEGSVQSYSYDKADRLIGPEVSYDNFGRITSLPGAYAGGGTLSTTFYANDLVATQSQGGITNSYKLDSALRPRERVQTGGSGGTEIFHYAGGSDAPAWTAKGTAWTRSIPGIGGELAAIHDSATGVSLQLANLHGDVVATASLSQSATGPTATFEFDEFGNPKQSGTPRYGWLGGKQRGTELPSGVIQMGVRSYVPAVGRFISTDPVMGGSANAYDYANADPVNGLDLDGRKPCGLTVKVSSRRHRMWANWNYGCSTSKTRGYPSPITILKRNVKFERRTKGLKDEILYGKFETKREEEDRDPNGKSRNGRRLEESGSWRCGDIGRTYQIVVEVVVIYQMIGFEPKKVTHTASAQATCQR